MCYLIIYEFDNKTKLRQSSHDVESSLAAIFEDVLASGKALNIYDYTVLQLELADKPSTEEYIMRNSEGYTFYSTEYDSYAEFSKNAFEFFGIMDDVTVYRVVKALDFGIKKIQIKVE